MAMHWWNLVWCTKSSVGSATSVVSRDIRLQSIGVAVKHHTPTDTRHTSRWHKDKTNSNRKNRKASFSLHKVLLVFYKVLWLESLTLVKVPIVSRCLARGKLTERKFMKMRTEKTKELQKGAWNYKRFNRGWLYTCVHSFLGSCT